jgi:hypothetical protein
MSESTVDLDPRSTSVGHRTAFQIGQRSKPSKNSLPNAILSRVLILRVVASENSVQIDSQSAAESEHHLRMIASGLLFLRLLCDRFKPRQQLEAEILVLRHQRNILQQRAPGRPHLRWVDRALFIWLYRRCPRILNAITVVGPETVLRWHRMGFSAYWRWKSGSPGGRPRIAKEVRGLIRRMSLENPRFSGSIGGSCCGLR